MTDSTQSHPSQQLTVPVTGEVIDLRAHPTDSLADAFDQIRDIEQQLASARRRIADELTQRLDHEAVRTFTAGDWTVTVDAPTRTAYDAPALRHALEAISADGHISMSAVDRACPLEPKASVREVEKIRRVIPADAAGMIDGCRMDQDRARRVAVKRAER
jgi:hypothetical protein